jgi:Tfp pilus assembly protein PilN
MTTDPNSTAAEALPESAETPAAVRRPGLARWTAFGTGVGIEIRDTDLYITVIRVRPSETGVLGAAAVTDYRSRPAAEWGGEVMAFLRKVGAGHIAATALLPRRDVIVRTVHLPGVSDRDLESAVALGIDSLHPFADEEVSFSWARIGKSPFVLVGIARRQIIDTYSSLFAEAGLKIGSFTFSAAAVYSALRVITAPPANFVIVQEAENGFEVYGESEARPIYSATLPVSRDRALAVAQGELRLEPGTEARHLSELLPVPSLFPADYDPHSTKFEANALPYATALTGACPWLGISGNLMPTDLRRGSSRIRLVPSISLAVILAVLLTLLAIQASWFDARYLDLLQHEISKYEPNARRVESLNRTITTARTRSQSLDDFRRRSKLDMDALAEITKLIPPPGWVSNLEMDRQSIQIAGEADQAATLLKAFDNSPFFEKSEFTMPITKSATGEAFRIRSMRQTPALTAAAPAPAKPAAGGSN